MKQRDLMERISAMLLSLIFLFAFNTKGFAQTSGAERYGTAPRAFPFPIQDGNNIGRAIAIIGDVNGNGTADYAVAATDSTGNTATIRLLFMAANGAIDSTSVIDATESLLSGFEDWDMVSCVLAPIGDVNNDGVPDLGVGTPDARIDSDRLGAVHFILLTSAGQVLEHHLFSPASTGFSHTPEPDTRFGSSLCAVGDLDLDGRAEIFVGAASGNSFTTNGGGGYIMSIDQDFNITRCTQLDTEHSGLRDLVIEEGADLGASCAPAGDLDEDGVPDLLVGSPGGSGSGSVHVFYLDDIGRVHRRGQVDPDSAGPFPGVETGARFGAVLAPLTILDHKHSYVVASPIANGSKGMAWILEIDSTSALVNIEAIWDSVATGSITVPYSGTDGFGSALGYSYDPQADDHSTLLLGAPSTLVDGRTSGTFWCLPVENDPDPSSIITDIRTLTALNTASGTATVLVPNTSGQPLDVAWDSGLANGLHYDKVKKGPILLQAITSEQDTILKRYTMGYEVHWSPLSGDSLVKNDLTHKELGQTTVMAKANSYYPILDTAWVEYSLNARAGSRCFGFGGDVFSGPGDVTAGFYFSADGNAYVVQEGLPEMIGPVHLGSTYRVEKIGSSAVWFVDLETIHSANVEIHGALQLYGVVFGYGNSLAALRNSHPPAAVVSFDITHTTIDEPESGSVIARPNWGIPPYKYQWNTGSKSDRITGVGVGSYDVTVIDQKMVTTTATAVVTIQATLFPTDGVRFDSNELIRIEKEEWGSSLVHSENIIEAVDSGWVQLTILDSPADLNLILRDTTTRDQFEFRADDKYLYPGYTGSSSDITLLEGREDPLDLKGGDIIAIQKIFGPNGPEVHFLHNGQLVLAYADNIAGRPLGLTLDLSNAYEKAADLVGRFSRIEQRGECDNNWNYRTVTVFNEDGTVQSQTRNYLDHLGRTVQSQVRDVDANNILVSQTVYDHLGRPALQTLPAPAFQTRGTCFKPDFLTTSAGAAFGPEHFDRSDMTGTTGERSNPIGVSNTSRGSLGWYYSNNNTSDRHVASSAYPYLRTIYHHDLTGATYAQHGPGEVYKPGSGHGVRQFTMRGDDILHRLLPRTKWGGTQVVKTITIDAEQQVTVTYSNERGQLLAQCLSDVESECPTQPVRTTIKGRDHDRLDVHIPVSQKRVHGNSNTVSSLRIPDIVSSNLEIGDQVIVTITDIETGRKLLPNVDYQWATVTQNTEVLDNYVKFLGSYSSGPSFLRISYEIIFEPGDPLSNPSTIMDVPELEVWYTLDYSEWSLNEYSLKGELLSVIPPEGVDCNVPFEYSEPHYLNDFTGQVHLCEIVNDERLPQTIGHRIGTVVWDLGERIPASIPLSKNINLRRVVHISTSTWGRDPEEADPEDPNASVYIGNYEPNGAPTPEQPCDYRPHTTVVFPDFPTEVLLESTVRHRQHIYDSEYSRSQALTEITEPFSPPRTGTFERSGLREFDVPSTPGPCIGQNDQRYLSVRFVLKAYKILANEQELPLGVPDLSFNGGLYQNCECEKYWKFLSQSMPFEFPIEHDDQIQNIVLKLEDVFVATSAPWYPQTPYSALDYKHDLARFLSANLIVAVHSYPVLVTPVHSLKTTHQYNSLSQLVRTTDPDRGVTEYFYDAAGRPRFSRNAEQAAAGSSTFSFVDRDQAGRTVRTGVHNYDPAPGAVNILWDNPLGTGTPAANTTRHPDVLAGVEAFNSGNLSEVSTVLYDAPASDFPATEYPQLDQHVPAGAVSRVQNDHSTTWYSYDVRGRLAWTVHYTPGLADHHSIHYAYGVRGQVERTTYQQEVAAERFDQWYEWDRTGRLRKVLTGQDGLRANASEQAAYQYYQHGPLKRTEIGSDLQGVDLVYTLQGWLKAMNGPGAADPGGDADPDGARAHFAPDQFALALEYHPGDYVRANTDLASDLGQNVAPARYNGLVRAQRWHNRALADPSVYTHGSQQLFYGYKYDLHGQLTHARLGTVSISTAPQVTLQQDYQLNNITYDRNGNLLTLHRSGQQSQAMDQLTYNYPTSNGRRTSNRLTQVTDQAPDLSAHTTFGLPAGQSPGNYSYNAQGQLVGDAFEGRYFTYYANGRVQTVYADATHTQKLAHFTYDAAGNRLLKETYASDGTNATTRTWYLRDGSGALHCYRQQDLAASTTTEELPIAGVGSYLRPSNEVRYTLTDHLGNTRVSFVRSGTGLQVVEAHDYYPHGGLMPGRQFTGSTTSPLAYQGQEYDEEVGLTAFNLRQYDARLGRWLTPDPYGQHYSPYLAMSNNPVSFVDPDGGYDLEMWVDGMRVFGFDIQSVMDKMARSGGKFDLQLAARDGNGRVFFGEELTGVFMGEDGILRGGTRQATYVDQVQTIESRADGKHYWVYKGLFKDPYTGERLVVNTTCISVYREYGSLADRFRIVNEVASLRDVSGAGHMALDGIGMIQGFGEIADGLNAAWYALEGNEREALLAVAAMAPVAGVAITAGKWTKRGNDAVQAGKNLPTPAKGQKVYRVYGGDSAAGGASWSPVRPDGIPNYRDAAGLPSGGASGATNTGQFVIEGTLMDPSKVVKSRSALELDGNQGGLPEFIIPGWMENGAIRIDRVSGVNPQF